MRSCLPCLCHYFLPTEQPSNAAGNQLVIHRAVTAGRINSLRMRVETGGSRLLMPSTWVSILWRRPPSIRCPPRDRLPTVRLEISTMSRLTFSSDLDSWVTSSFKVSINVYTADWKFAYVAFRSHKDDLSEETRRWKYQPILPLAIS